MILLGNCWNELPRLGPLVLVAAVTACVPLSSAWGQHDMTARADHRGEEEDTTTQAGGVIAADGKSGYEQEVKKAAGVIRQIARQEKKSTDVKIEGHLTLRGTKELVEKVIALIHEGEKHRREMEKELARERRIQQEIRRIVGDIKVSLQEKGEPGLLDVLRESITRHKKEKELTKERRIQQEIERIVGDIKVSLQEEGKSRQLDLIRGPLLRPETPPYFVRGTTWAWGTHGRPQALLSLALSSCTGGSAADPHWYYEMVSLSTKPISATTRNNTWWATQTAGWNPQPIPDALEVAATPEERLRQMKDLARRFSAHRYATYKPGPKRLEKVSLLDEPILRYATSSGDTVDGAIFVFSGWLVNPEIFLVIEAERDPQGTVTWKYNVSRSGIYEFVLKCDGREVWHPEAINITKVSDIYRTYGISAKEEIRLSQAEGQ